MPKKNPHHRPQESLQAKLEPQTPSLDPQSRQNYETRVPKEENVENRNYNTLGEGGAFTLSNPSLEQVQYIPSQTQPVEQPIEQALTTSAESSSVNSSQPQDQANQSQT